MASDPALVGREATIVKRGQLETNGLLGWFLHVVGIGIVTRYGRPAVAMDWQIEPILDRPETLEWSDERCVWNPDEVTA